MIFKEFLKIWAIYNSCERKNKINSEKGPILSQKILKWACAKAIKYENNIYFPQKGWGAILHVDIASLDLYFSLLSSVSYLIHLHHIFIISQLWLTSHPRSALVLLDTGTPGINRDIDSEDADGETRTRNSSVINRVL